MIVRSTWSFGIAALVALIALTACSNAGAPSGTTGRLRGVALLGPTCPVEPAPGAPSDETCVDMPLDEAGIVIVDDEGSQSMRLTTGLDGSFTADLAPGEYRLIPQPVEGLLGTPQPVAVIVTAGKVTRIDPIVYDTGIR